VKLSRLIFEIFGVEVKKPPGRLIFLYVSIIIGIAILIASSQFDIYSFQWAALITAYFCILFVLGCISIVNPNFFWREKAITARIKGVLIIGISIYMVFNAWNIYWSQ